MMPGVGDFLRQPLQSFETVVEIIKLSEAHSTAVTAEKRKKRVDDVAKRSAYRKAHGLDNQSTFGGWTAKEEAQALGPALPATGEETQLAAHEPEKRKKWLGIF
jgi:hypothetical protein